MNLLRSSTSSLRTLEDLTDRAGAKIRRSLKTAFSDAPPSSLPPPTTALPAATSRPSCCSSKSLSAAAAAAACLVDVTLAELSRRMSADALEKLGLTAGYRLVDRVFIAGRHVVVSSNRDLAYFVHRSFWPAVFGTEPDKLKGAQLADARYEGFIVEVSQFRWRSDAVSTEDDVGRRGRFCCGLIRGALLAISGGSSSNSSSSSLSNLSNSNSNNNNNNRVLANRGEGIAVRCHLSSAGRARFLMAFPVESCWPASLHHNEGELLFLEHMRLYQLEVDYSQKLCRANEEARCRLADNEDDDDDDDEGDEDQRLVTNFEAVSKQQQQQQHQQKLEDRRLEIAREAGVPRSAELHSDNAGQCENCDVTATPVANDVDLNSVMKCTDNDVHSNSVLDDDGYNHTSIINCNDDDDADEQGGLNVDKVDASKNCRNYSTARAVPLIYVD